MTYLINQYTLTIRKDIEQATGTLQKRNEYRLERAGVVAN